MDYYEVTIDGKFVAASDDTREWASVCVALENALTAMGMDYATETTGDFEMCDGIYSWRRYTHYTTMKD